MTIEQSFQPALTAVDLQTYARDGVLILRGVFHPDEIATLASEAQTLRELIEPHHEKLLESWNESSEVEIRSVLAMHVEVGDDALAVELSDGRSVTAPLAWFPRLLHATPEERRQWRLIGGGSGIHWPAIDEDISIANLLAGQPSAESQTSFKKWLSSREKPPRSRKRSGR